MRSTSWKLTQYSRVWSSICLYPNFKQSQMRSNYDLKSSILILLKIVTHHYSLFQHTSTKKNLTESFSTIAAFPWNCCPSHVRHDASICKREHSRVNELTHQTAQYRTDQALFSLLDTDEQFVENKCNFSNKHHGSSCIAFIHLSSGPILLKCSTGTLNKLVSWWINENKANIWGQVKDSELKEVRVSSIWTTACQSRWLTAARLSPSTSPRFKRADVTHSELTTATPTFSYLVLTPCQ